MSWLSSRPTVHVKSANVAVRVDKVAETTKNKARTVQYKRQAAARARADKDAS